MVLGQSLAQSQTNVAQSLTNGGAVELVAAPAFSAMESAERLTRSAKQDCQARLSHRIVHSSKTTPTTVSVSPKRHVCTYDQQ